MLDRSTFPEILWQRQRHILVSEVGDGKLSVFQLAYGVVCCVCTACLQINKSLGDRIAVHINSLGDKGFSPVSNCQNIGEGPLQCCGQFLAVIESIFAIRKLVDKPRAPGVSIPHPKYYWRFSCIAALGHFHACHKDNPVSYTHL